MMHIYTFGEIRRSMRFRRVLPATLLMLISTLLAACGVTTSSQSTPISMFPTSIPQGSPLPTFGGVSESTPTREGTSAPPTPARPSVPTLDANWSSLAPGMDYRRLSFTNASGQSVTVIVARIDPARATFKVAYTPGQAKVITDWLGALQGATVIVNANYFDTSNNPLGMVISNGTMYSSPSQRSDAGQFQVIGTAVRVRQLWNEPLTNGEHFDQVIQGYPILVSQGQAAPAFDRTLNNTPAPRTVIAQDLYGRILIMVTSPGLASFTDMAKWLAVSGLEIDTALNLDGGQSSAMVVTSNGTSSVAPGLSPVPVVLAVYPR